MNQNVQKEILDSIRIITEGIVKKSTPTVLFGTIVSVDGENGVCHITTSNTTYVLPYYGGKPKVRKKYPIVVPPAGISQAFVVGGATNDDGVATAVDYTTLENKPQINGVTLTGNKTSAELNIEADKTYTYTQATATQTWEITHNLAKYPSVTIVDSSGNIVIGEISYTDENNLTVTFMSAFSGKAYLN